MSGEILTPEALAERWSVPASWVYSKARTGELPKMPLPGKYVRFRLDVVERFERGEMDAGDGRALGSADNANGAAPPQRPAPGTTIGGRDAPPT
jgi:hypothetical protein